MSDSETVKHRLVEDPQALRAAIEKQWKGRAEARGLKPGSAAYSKAEVEFFTGAMSALNAVFPNTEDDRLSPMVPVLWVINAMSGRPIAEK